ncbi:RagB/SusD family nutrient uptake outer membrane protein [Aquimarina sp. 2201CG5-10]|uniref:RagB/SusD family nutrient uptake outer membrane protein n=1 Tax=Aquimarina callyspongiae TaxID=3098150 RepID=UPI002AB4AD35|nr:RagB/SusD family nutrient uptake outer membrane protein [Aquimarina sp. 2201CG5-10]MDY8134173.1 RagB/SusD family nutrient uptake outer membrane protein [Aquimarina sp. 2201CG5-10]
MKDKYNIIMVVISIMLVTACEDDFLDKTPQDELSAESTFSNNNAIQAYTWQFYERFRAHNETTRINIDEDSANETRPASGFGLNEDAEADLIQQAPNGVGKDYLWSRIIVPSTDEDWTESYRAIRKINLLLDNVPKSDLSDTDKEHWRSIGLFFRAFEYFSLLKKYGAVPWIEFALTEESEELYAPRTPRDQVATNMLNDLLWAEEHIKPAEASNRRKVIDEHAINALISRFGLFEGTWRKYHNLGNSDTYLQVCTTASEKLMVEFGSLHPKYDELHNSESLEGVAGIILFKEYNELENWSNMSTTFRASNSTWDITRKGVDKFLCKDGRTRWNSPLFEGDTDMFAELRNRDDRLLFMTPAPYFVVRTSNTTWVSTGNPGDEEYFSVYETISDNLHKSLPDLNWRGNVVSRVPNFNQNRVAGFNRTFSGYRVWRHYNQYNTGTSSRDFADAPIFRMGEILLNYAESKYELGEFDQSIADMTINQLRVRGDVASMVLSDIDANFDPTRDVTVDPVLFEIRRERAVELMAEGFRREDLRRWRKMHYASEVKLGRWITSASQDDKVPIQNGASEGYVQLVPGTPPLFPDHYYLFPLPSDQIVLNPNLEQNPGW